uniref:Uncharacterized protein n=1 Tax=mine drainage metagenome TaxID=410659 RepID=E6QC42_9ZZZZ
MEAWHGNPVVGARAVYALDSSLIRSPRATDGKARLRWLPLVCGAEERTCRPGLDFFARGVLRLNAADRHPFHRLRRFPSFRYQDPYPPRRHPYRRHRSYGRDPCLRRLRAVRRVRSPLFSWPVPSSLRGVPDVSVRVPG